MEGREKGVDQPFPFRIEAFRRDREEEVTLQVVVILVDFNDQPANRRFSSREHYQSMLFSRAEYRTGSMRDWYRENSYGGVDVVGGVYGWYRMPQPYSFYVGGQNGFGEYPRNAQGLVRDALLAADDDIDYSQYDNRGEGVVEALFVVHAGPGAEVTGSSNDIWSHAWFVPGNLMLDGVRFRRYSMVPEDGQIGVFGHELAHSFFGLPDLYDVTYRSAGLGRWSMMAAGSWGEGGRRPVHFDAWSKVRVGFITPTHLTQPRSALVLPPVENDPQVFLLWRLNEEVNREYFLVENRRRVSFDRAIPGNGLLIYHIDESMDGNRNPWTPDEGGELHYMVALEQADGAYDLERNQNSGDEGDPFPGITFNETFSHYTRPSSRDYQGRSTSITLDAIEIMRDGQVRFDLSFNPNFSPPEPSIYILNHIPGEHRYPHPDRRGDTIWTDELALFSGLLATLGLRPSIGEELPPDLSPFNTLIYLESWREEERPSLTLSLQERRELRRFLERGGNVLLVGPDIATHLQGDTILWPLLGATYRGEGVPREDGNLRRLLSNPDSRVNGQNFIYTYRGYCDHYVDQVSGDEEAGDYLFTDQDQNPRGVILRSESGGRVILQPFLWGGLLDWGGRKLTLLQKYMAFFRFRLTPMAVGSEPSSFPQGFNLSVYPNPFNRVVTIRWRGSWGIQGFKVYDLMGRQVAAITTLIGAEALHWKPLGLASGPYWLAPTFSYGEGPKVMILYLP